MLMMYVYLIDFSPLRLFTANEKKLYNQVIWWRNLEDWEEKF